MSRGGKGVVGATVPILAAKDWHWFFRGTLSCNVRLGEKKDGREKYSLFRLRVLLPEVISASSGYRAPVFCDGDEM